MIIMLAKVRDSKTIDNGHMMALNGKLNHYMYLVPEGPWQRGFLLKLQDQRESPSKLFEVTELVQKQASWWVTNIRAAQQE